MSENWRERIRKYGKQAVVTEEMVRLGFWPPDTVAQAGREQALVEMQAAQTELVQLRTALADIETQIAAAEDVEAQIVEIRRKRIERVRAQRAERRAAKEARIAEHRAADSARRREKPPFLGHGVSAGLRYDDGDAAKVAALGLPALTTAANIADAIGITPPELAWLTYHRGAASLDHYHRFTIPKRTGGTRTISSPKKRLRVVQAWLLAEVVGKLEVHDAAMAFRSARSILDNARRHVGHAIVVRLDLKDFFPNIGFGRVRGLFRSFGYTSGVATILALLATEAPRVALTLDGQKRYVSIGQRQLPQGACTSPALTNILCRSLDRRLVAAAAVFGFTYTRYADDLVFSHPDKDTKLGAFLAFVQRIITDEGFVVNPDKTRIMRKHQRQAVTGLVVNGAPHISRADLRRFRAFLHHCETDGIAAMSQQMGKSALAYGRGYIAFITMVSPDKAARFVADHPWLAQHGA